MFGIARGGVPRRRRGSRGWECPGPGPTITLGSWVNEAQREAEIRNFLARRG
jgi:hypothetical protein